MAAQRYVMPKKPRKPPPAPTPTPVPPPVPIVIDQPPIVTPPPPTTNPSGFSWKVMKIGAGGWVTGIDIAADGTKVIRTDTYGGYVWNGSAWAQLVTSTALPAGYYGFNGSGDAISTGGVYSICIAPSNTSRFYMVFDGYVFRSDNSGATWSTPTNTQFTNCNPNETGAKVTGPKIAVDPQNADVVYVGTAEQGMYKSADAGASWTHDTGVATNTTTRAVIIAFDPSSSVSGSPAKTQGIYASSYGNGVYHSTNGGTSWTLTTGTPTTHVHMVCTSAGVVWLTAASGANTLWKYASSTWTNVVTGTQTDRGQTIAIDPADSTKMYIGMDSGNLITSTDSGGSWTNPNFNDTRTATDIPWLEAANETYMSNGNMMFDPSQSHVLYFSEGIGVWKTAAPGATTAWTSQSAGIEQLVVNTITVPPGGKPNIGCWDRPVFYSSDPAVYPSDYGPDPTHSHAIVMGWDISYLRSDPTKLVGLINWLGVEESGYSTDGGQTWTAFAAYPAGVQQGGCIGGCMTRIGASTVVWLPENGCTGYYSTNNGGSWTILKITGINTVTPVSVCLSQQRGSAGNLTINGEMASAGAVTFDAATLITIYGGNQNEAVNNYTITGTNAIGGGINETIAGPTPFSTVSTSLSFKTVTQVSISAAGLCAVTIGNRGESGWGQAYYLNRHVICGDANDDYYAFNNGTENSDGSGTNADGAIAGVYKSTDGITWTKVTAGRFNTYVTDYYNAKLRAVPGNPGHLFYTAGDVGGSIFGSFFRSTNGGSSWTAVANVLEVKDFSFGKAASGGYPSVFIVGFLSGVYGIYRSDDNCVSWTALPTYPLGSIDQIGSITGDLDTYGKCYVGFSGSGCAYYG